MGAASPSPSRDAVPPPAQHLATISHQGRFWDVYVELESGHASGPPFRASLAYSPADQGGGEPVRRTIPVLVEASVDELSERARRLEEHELVAFLRSLLP